MKGWRTLFPNAWYVAVREYRSRVRTRSFVLGTVLLAVIAFAATQLPVLVDFAAGSSQTRLEVVSTPGMPADSLSLLSETLNGQISATAHPPFVVSWLAEGDIASAQQALENGKFDALLIVDRDPASKNLTFTLRTDLASDGPVVTSIRPAVALLALDDALARAGTSIGAVQATPLTVLPVNPSAGPANSVSREVSTDLLSTGLIVLIFMAIITYGVWVAMSVA